jgi:hypothetical protein
MVRQAWEKGMPICSEELTLLFQSHVSKLDCEKAKELFVTGKKNTVSKFLQRTLKRNHYSIRKNTISQSVTVDW